MEPYESQSDWHLDKKVSIFVILTLMANVAMTGYGMVWYASKIDSRVVQLERRPSLIGRVIKLESLTGEYGRLLARLDNTLSKLDMTLDVVAKEQARRTPFIEQIRTLKH